MKRFLASLLIAAFLAACGSPHPAEAATNAQSITFLLSQVRNTSGPLAGGKVYAYAAGTSTPKTIWLNRSKSTVAANPYTLDSNGTAPLFGDGLYRFVIKTAAGVTVYDRDYVSVRDASGYVYNVEDYASLAAAVAAIGNTRATLQYSTDQTLSAHLSVPSTLELLPVNGAIINHGSYTVYYGGSTARWDLAQKFNGTGAVTGLREFRPEWNGATGGADDTIALKKTFVDGAGANIYLVSGRTYTTDGSFMKVYSNTTVWGYGATLKIKDGSYTSAVYFLGTSATVNPVSGDPSLDAVTENVTIRGLTMDGNTSNITTTASSTAVFVYRGKNWTIEDVVIKEMPGEIGGGYGIIGSMSDGVYVNRCEIDRTDRSNVYVWETKNFVITNSKLNGSYYRDCITAGGNDPQQFQRSNLKISNSVLTSEYPTSTHVLRFSGPVDGMLNNLEINGYLADNGGGSGATATATISGGVVTGVNITSGGSGYTTVPDIQILGGGGSIATATATVSAGAVDTITVTDGGTGYTSAPDVRIGEGSEGIYIAGTIPISVVANNVRINNAQYGVLMETNAAHNLQMNNFEIGGTTAARNGIRILSSGSSVKFTNGLIKSTLQPLYVAFATRSNTSGVDIEGGSSAISLLPVTGGTTVFANNTIKGMTSASYSVLVGGDSAAVPSITGNVCRGNTVDQIRGLYSGRFIGNDCTVVATGANSQMGNSTRTVQASAVPVIDTWGVNDRAVRFPSAVGQPCAWSVTTAGGAYSTTRANSTAYTSNTWAKWTTGTTVWKCTTAGTSDVAAPSIAGKVVGDTVTDGTVIWTMQSLTSAVFTSEGNL